MYTKSKSIQKLIVAGVVLLLAGQLSHADNKGNGGKPIPDSQYVAELPAGFFNPTSCTFPIRFSANGEKKEIKLPDNRTIFIFPTYHAIVTNLEDESKWIELNVPGTSKQTIRNNGDVVTVATGRNLLGDPEAGLVLAIGTFSYIFDKNGTLIQPLTGTGKLINVCELIS